jgi:Ca2+-binding RTX toxin-like protein
MTTPSSGMKLGGEALEAVGGGNFVDRHGTPGGDNIIPTNPTDLMGMDKIFAGAGNDHVVSRASADEVHGGEGDDVLDLGEAPTRLLAATARTCCWASAGTMSCTAATATIT